MYVFMCIIVALKNRLSLLKMHISEPAAHIMARANPNKSEELVTNTTTGSKYRSLESASILLIKFSKTVFYEVNLVSQCLVVLLLSKFWSERRDFN